MARRVLASAIAVAVVVARFLVGSSVPVELQRRAAVETPVAPHRTAARSPRAAVDASRASRSFGIGALIGPPAHDFSAPPPPPLAALVFEAPAAPTPAPTPAPARARDPPVI